MKGSISCTSYELHSRPNRSIILKGRRARRWGSGSLSEIDKGSKGVEDNEEDADPGGRGIPVQSAELFGVSDKVSTISPGGKQFKLTV